MLVISVTIKLHGKDILNNTLRQNMKVSSMLVIIVNTKLHGQKILKDTMI